MDLNKLVDENQTIKIVPSIEESLRSIGLNVDVDDGTLLWFTHLKATWKAWKRNPTVENIIESFYSSRSDSHRVALVLVVKCEDFKECKPKSLPYYLLEILQKWAKKYSIKPDDCLKPAAFQIGTTQRNPNFFSLLANTYELHAIKEIILSKIKEMIDEGNFKQATQIVITMDLFEDVPVEDLLFPLILQDKSNMIDEYLAECPNQIRPFLQFLDKLLARNFSIREYVQNYLDTHRITEVKYEKLHYKPLGKLVARLCNKFKIPIESCKNLSKNRTTGGLRYLIYQKYQERNISSAVWDDLVKDSLKQNVEAAEEFIDMLSEYDRKEAQKWADYLNMPKNMYPTALKTCQDNVDTVLVEENWDDEPSSSQIVYQLSVTDDQIIFIDTGEKFYNMMANDLSHCKVVGIDCEWKPSFGATQSQVALIQVATNNRVYLIDSSLLNKKEFSSFWCSFNKSLLENAEIIKLGFGIEQDLREMKASIIGLNNIKVKGEGFLDMFVLWKSLIQCGLTFPNKSDNGNGLSSLVQLCFGLPLAKTEQCSNWELRPLRNTQIKYAALDAYVLLELYYFLQKACQQQGIGFDEICNDIMLEGKQKTSKKSRHADRIQTPAKNKEARSVTDLKFLVEPKLSGLMSYLRYCGIDTKVMANKMLWHDVVNLAISESRLILLSKIKYSPTETYPQNHIFEVSGSNQIIQMKAILEYFNVNINKSLFLSRCIYCNENILTKLSLEELKNINDEYKQRNSNCFKYNHNDNDDATNYDNFLSDSDCDEDLYQAVSVTKHYTNESIKTSKGVTLQLEDLNKLISQNKTALLCESCGKLLWDEEILLKSVENIVQSVTQLSLS